MGFVDFGEGALISVLSGSESRESYTREIFGCSLAGSAGGLVLGKLMANFLATLKELGEELWRLVLVNAGVKFAIEGSEQLVVLQALDTHPSRVLVCGTCLNHFQLLEAKQAGETTNMLDIVTAMQLADKVITLT